MSAKKAKRMAGKGKPYEASPREQAILQSLYARQEKQQTAPRMKVSKRGTEPDHPDCYTASALLMDALGTVEYDFLRGLLGQLAKTGTQRGDATIEAVEDGLNFMLALVTGMEPKDQIETMLLSQMAAVHNATMTFARRLNHADSFLETDYAERTFNKLARTFALQMETLKRYRTGGEQRVRVEHITVNEGDRAVVLPFRREAVGDVGRERGVGGSLKMKDNPMSRANEAPRCGAQNRRGVPCGRFALRGKQRCEFHGGTSPGAPCGKRNGMYKHGQCTLEAMEQNRYVRELIRGAREFIKGC